MDHHLQIQHTPKPFAQFPELEPPEIEKYLNHWSKFLNLD